MKTILAIEDEVGLRMAIEGQLSRRGEVQVISARSKEEALEIIRKRSRSGEAIDAAVVDVRLVSKDGVDQDAGFRAVALLAKDFPDTPVVVLTVRNDREAWNQAEKKVLLGLLPSLTRPRT